MGVPEGCPQNDCSRAKLRVKYQAARHICIAMLVRVEDAQARHQVLEEGLVSEARAVPVDDECMEPALAVIAYTR
jgi:hypothetical protein